MPPKKTASAPAPSAPELPDPAAHPKVVALRTRRQELADERDAARAARVAAELDLGAGPGADDTDLEARLVARGDDPAPVARLRELRRNEKVLAKAIALVDAELTAAAAAAVAELTPAVREAVFLPAARRASAAWLAAATEVEAFRVLVEDIRGRGLGNGAHSNFNRPVPLSLADRDAFRAFAAMLVEEGHADPADVDAAFPGLRTA